MPRKDSMKLPHRRHVLHLAASAAALPTVSRFAFAQTYPSRPVRFIVGFAPGGGVDITARLIGQWLSDRLGRPFIIENRPGAGANIAMEAVAKAAPDGYTLLLVSPGAAINATLYDNLNYNFTRDIASVAGIYRVPNVLAVHPTFPAKDIPEFIAYAKANPRKVNMALAGIGAMDHMCGELFKMMAGVDLVPVPYRGISPALTDLIAGQVQVSFPPISLAIQYIRAEKLRALAVTTLTRSDVLPNAPSISEFIPGYDVSTWYGVGVPSNTPAEIIDTLNREINAALADPGIRARLAELGGEMLPGSPGDFGRLVADETEKWAEVIKFAGIKAD
jgi:tripartite-type tricarboxylate transporter receptor subunit TctC